MLHIVVAAAKHCGPGGRARRGRGESPAEAAAHRAPSAAPASAEPDGQRSAGVRHRLSVPQSRADPEGRHRGALVDAPDVSSGLGGAQYRQLFPSSRRPQKPGPKGPSEALIRAIVELKSRNPRFGCPRMARIISRAFGVDIDKNVVYRVLSKHYRPSPRGRPGDRRCEILAHDRRKRSRWHRVTVSGLTIVRRLVHPGHECRRATQNARSTLSSRAWGRSFFSAVTCCRSARFSITTRRRHIARIARAPNETTNMSTRAMPAEFGLPPPEIQVGRKCLISGADEYCRRTGRDDKVPTAGRPLAHEGSKEHELPFLGLDPFHETSE